MPLLTKRKVLAAVQESTPGTGVSLSSSNDVIGAYDVVIDADIPWNERVAPGSFGRQVSNIGAYAGSLKFKVEAVGGGSEGTAPAWASVLLPACGMNLTSGAFTPVSAASSQKAVTIAVLEDGLEKKLVGAMGTWKFNGDDGKIPFFEFDFKGVWTSPSDVSMFAPNFGSSYLIPPRFASASIAFECGSGGTYNPTCSKFSLDYGAKVALRQDVTTAAGYISAIIVDRVVKGNLDPEATLLSTFDQFGLWQTGQMFGSFAELAMQIGGGTNGAGFTITCNQVQFINIKEGDRAGILTSGIDFMAMISNGEPDSEITIQF